MICNGVCHIRQVRIIREVLEVFQGGDPFLQGVA